MSVSAADRLRDIDRGRLLAGVAVVAVLTTLAVLLVIELNDSNPGGSAAAPPPLAEPTEAPSATVTASDTEPPLATEPPPEESPTGDLAPGTTAIFRGEPATGPWQSIGSVSERTAAGADPLATFGYEDDWKAYGLSDQLWDELVARVSLKAVPLGPPLERPVLNGAAGSEPFNARGGLQWTDEDTEGRGHLVAFDAIYDHDGMAVWPRWAFLIDAETHEVLVEFPRVEVAEDEVDTVDEATDRLSEQLWPLVLEQPRNQQ